MSRVATLFHHAPYRGTIQALVNAAPAGGTVTVPRGTYRETVTINKALTLIGAPGAQIRGSDVWTGWTAGSGVWTHSGAPNWSTYTGTAESSDTNNPPTCQIGLAVYFDGMKQTYTSNATPTAGQFTVAKAGGTVTIGSDPTGHLVEVTTRQFWVTIGTSNVTVSGFTCLHAGCDASRGGIDSGGNNNITVRNCTLSYSHGAAINLGAGSTLTIDSCDLGYNGECGALVYGASFAAQAATVTVTNCTIHHNNQDRFTTSGGSAEASGMKMTEVNGATIANNTFANNRSHGLWVDIDCANFSIHDNSVTNNSGNGIKYEISNHGTIYNNSVVSNTQAEPNWGKGAGILIQNSHHCTVYSNSVLDNSDGICVVEEDRTADDPASGDPHWPTNNSIHDNHIRMQADGGNAIYSLAWVSTDPVGSQIWLAGSNNSVANNSVTYPAAAGGLNHENANQYRFSWHDVDYDNIAGFAATTGGAGTTYVSGP